MKLGKYGIILKSYMREYMPIRYNELIISGDIMNYFLEEEKDINNKANIIEKNLRDQYLRPRTNSFIELAQYENMIKNLVDEYIKDEIYNEYIHPSTKCSL